MDPNANLTEQLKIARFLLGTDLASNEMMVDKAERLSELVLELDDWMKAGGFVPARWNEGR